MKRLMFGLISALALPTLASASVLVNPSFETGDLTGWTASGGISASNAAGDQTDGDFGVVFPTGTGLVGNNQTTILRQDIDGTLLNDNGSLTITVDLFSDRVSGGPGKFTARLLGDGSILEDEQTQAGGGAFFPLTFTVDDIGNFGTYQIFLRSETGTNSVGTTQFKLDNVVLSGSALPVVDVPEPASLALLGLGMMAMASRRRRIARV